MRLCPVLGPPAGRIGGQATSKQIERRDRLVPAWLCAARAGLERDPEHGDHDNGGHEWPHRPGRRAGFFAKLTTRGIASYISVMERGYALHELTFALLFIVFLAVPFRRRQRWAWWVAWLPIIANLGYTFTFGAHDHATSPEASSPT